jgi:hypothetical protein
MLHNGAKMAHGRSGRIVLEIEVELKRRLYSRLAREGATLKEWFVSTAEAYLRTRAEPLQLNIRDLLSRKDEK